MSERSEVEEQVCVLEYQDEHNIPVLEMMRDLQDALSHIPIELHPRATVRIGSEGYLGDISVLYMRPETDAELAARAQRIAFANNETRRRELELLKRLQAKYGSETHG